MDSTDPPNLYSGRYFPDAKAAALQYQYEARLRAANARDVARFGAMHCKAMQLEAAALYAAARAAMAST